MGLFACPFSLCGVEIVMVFGNIGLSGQNHPGLSVRALVPRKAVFVLGPWDLTVLETAGLFLRKFLFQVF